MTDSIALLGPYFELPPAEMPAHKTPFLSDAELAAATAKFVVSCNDIYFVDEKGRVVLAKRKIAAARGWWVFGGAATTGLTAEASVAKILKREIDFALPVELLATFELHWADSRERPGGYRQDRIFAWMARVDEATIAKIELSPDEYNVEAGLIRFDGSQPGLRPVLYDMLKLIQSKI